MFNRRLTVALLLVSALFVSVGWSQITTGNMRGVVSSDDGAPIPGVEVTIKSPALLAGVKTTTTNESGRFRFQSLPIGIYIVEATLEGFQSVQVTKVEVQLNTTANVPVNMKVASKSEEISVVGETPLIDVTQAGFSTNYSTEILENVPTQRYFYDLMQVAPGVTAAFGDNLNDRTIAFGSSIQSSSWSVDGLELSAPDSGADATYQAPDSIDEIQVIGVGAPAEFGNHTGAVFNVVTRKGGNVFHGGANYFFQSNGLSGTNVTLPDCNQSLPPGEACAFVDHGALPSFFRKQYYDFSATMGGPIKKDKLWFFGGTQILHDFYTDPGNNPSNAAPAIQDSWDFKLTGLSGHNNEWTGSYHRETFDAGAEDPFSTLTAMWRPRGHLDSWGGGITSTLSSSFLLEAHYGGWRVYGVQNGAQPNTLDPFIDFTPLAGGPPLSSGGVVYPWDNVMNRNQANAKATYYAQNFLKSQHEFRFGVQWSRGESDYQTAAGANGFYTYSLYGYTYRVYQSPYHYGGMNKEFGSFVDDTITVSPRLTLNLGVRFDHNTGDIPGYPILGVGTPSISAAGNWIETGGTSPAFHVMTWNNISPRAGFVWQTQADGKAVVQGSFGVYYDHNVSGNWDFPSPAVPDLQVYQYFPETETRGDLLFSQSYSNTVDPGIQPPRTLQYALGYQRQFKENVAVGAQYIYKDTTDLIGWNIVGGAWEPVPFTDPFTGRQYTLLSEVSAPVLQKGNSIGNFCDFIVGGETASMCDQRRDYWQKYHAVILTFTRRFANNWALNASYTWSHSYGLSPRILGQVQGNPLGNSPFGSDPNHWINASGDLQGDRPNMVRLQGFWNELPWDMTLAANLDLSNGARYTRQIFPPGRLLNQGPRRMVMQRGYSHPWFHVIDLTIGKRIPIGKTVEAQVNATIYNLLNADNSMSLADQVLQDTEAVFTETGWTKPRRLQIQLGLQF